MKAWTSFVVISSFGLIAAPAASGDCDPSNLLSPPASYQSDGRLLFVDLADFDQDGDLDVVTISQDQTIRVMTNEGGRLSAPTELPPVGFPWSEPVEMFLPDLNSDGWPDVLIANKGYLHTYGGDVRVHLNQGDGTLGQEIRMLTGSGFGIRIVGLDVGDIDNDGNIDAVMVTAFPATFRVLRNHGNGAWSSLDSLDLGFNARPRGISLRDIDGDGDLDAIVLWHPRPESELVVFENDGDGNLTEGPSVETGLDEPSLLAFGDVDSDGDLDLIASEDRTDRLAVLLNNGGGQFQIPIFYSGDRVGEKLLLEDINGDGVLDIIFLERSQWYVLVRVGGGDGSFWPTVGFYSGGHQNIASGDIDGDSDLDMVCIGRDDQGVDVLLNRCVPQPCQADFDMNGFLDSFDLSEFLHDFRRRRSSADLDQNGRYNFFDVAAYMSLYQAGCP